LDRCRVDNEGEAAFPVQLQGPLDVAASLETFRRNGDDLIDRWDGVRLVRTVRVGDDWVAYRAVPGGTLDAPVLYVTVSDPAYRPAVESVLTTGFIMPPAEYRDLLRGDPIVARLEGLYPGLRPVRQCDLLGALVRSISAQQVNLKWAATTRRRLAERFGRRLEVAGEVVYCLDAAQLAEAPVSEIRELQFTTRKSEYILAVARAVAEEGLSAEGLAELEDGEVISRLTAIRGIGVWTAEWILARTLGRPRVVAGDLGVRKAVGLAYLGDPLPSETAVRAATAHWGSSAGIAQQLLLNGLVHGALGPDPAA
jgi:DNA-3-methyladenine glycosylase II